MGTIGTWGSRSFVVSASKMVTFQDMQRKTAYRTESVDNEKNKPGTARISPELETISFTIQLLRSLGVNPQAEADAWRNECAAGNYHPLYIGGVKQGGHNYLIQSVTASECTYDKKGTLLSCKLAVAMQEYVKEMERQKESYESYDSGGGGGGGGGSRSVKSSVSKTAGTTKKVVGMATARRSESIYRMYTTSSSSKKK